MGQVGKAEEQTIRDRYALLRARILASEAVISYIDRVAHNFKEKGDVAALGSVKALHAKFNRDNKAEITELGKKYKGVVMNYQRKLAESLIMTSAHPAH